MAIALATQDNAEKLRSNQLGHLQVIIGTITFSSNYATGGEVVAPTFESILKVAGLGVVDFVCINPLAGYVFDYDYANKKVKTLYGDNNNAADGPLIEIPAAAYPAGVTGVATRFFVIGR